MGLLAYSASVTNLDENGIVETSTKGTESTSDTAPSKRGADLTEEHLAINTEYENLQRAYGNGYVPEEEYHAAIADLQQKELAVFEEAKNYDWDDSEITESNYFFRSVMKFPSPLQTHSADDVPPVFDDSKRQEYCSLMSEFDAAYAKFDALHPVPEEKNYGNAEAYSEALSEYVSLQTNNAEFRELEERKDAFGHAAYVECD